MLKKTLTFGALILLPLLVTPMPSQGSSIDATIVRDWKLDAKPLDMVHILGDDSNVHVFTADGKKQGVIKVDKGVTAIDIAPRGEMLYLTNSTNNTFTSLTVNFTTPIDITGSPFLGNENADIYMRT